MSLTSQNTNAISFKKVSGKDHTQQNFAVSEESIATNIQMSYTTVFGQKIEGLPVTNSGLTTLYSTNGIVQRVKFPIDIIPNTQIGVNQSQGYRLKLPADWNTHPGALYPKFTTGTYLHTALGKLQIVPSLYGTLKTDGTTEYDPILYQTNGSTVIAKFDPINWYFDPYSGVIFVEDPSAGYDISAARPGFLEAFLYVGDYVSDLLNVMTSGSTGTTAINVGTGIGVFKTKVGQILEFKSLSGIQGISVTGTTNDIIIGFTGATGGGTITGATNGLSVTGNNIKLGGLLTGNTNIDGNYNFLIGQNTKLLEFGIQTTDSNYDGSFSIVSNQFAVSILNIPSNNSTGLQITDSDFTATSYDTNSNRTGQLIVNQSGINLIGLNSGATVTQINLGNDSAGTFKLTDTRSGINQTGIEYASDYSATFSLRSLVDRNYVDNAIGISGATPASNGLSKPGSDIILGGDLTQDTVIGGTNSNPYKISIGDYDNNFGLKAIDMFANGSSANIRIKNETTDGGIYLQAWNDDSDEPVAEIQTTAGATNNGQILLRIAAETNHPSFITLATHQFSFPTSPSQDVSAATMDFTMKVDSAIFTDNRNSIIYQPGNVQGVAKGIEYAADYSAGFTPRSLVDKAFVTGLTSGSGSTIFSNGLTKNGNNVVLGGTITGNTIIDGSNTYSLNLTSLYSGTIQAVSGLTLQSNNAGGNTVLASYGGIVTVQGNDGLNLWNYSSTNALNMQNNSTSGFIVANNGGAFKVNGSGVDNNNDAIIFNSYAGNLRLNGYSGDLSLVSFGNGIEISALGTSGMTLSSINPIIVSGATTGFTGIQYATNYSSNFNKRSLVDVEYVTGQTNHYKIRTVTANTTINIYNQIMLVDTTTSALIVTLPLSVPDGKWFTIKDKSGNAATNNITVNPNGVNIDGGSSSIINTNSGSITVVFDAASNNYYVIGFVN